jgi:hypothetical protein
MTLSRFLKTVFATALISLVTVIFTIPKKQSSSDRKTLRKREAQSRKENLFI